MKTQTVSDTLATRAMDDLKTGAAIATAATVVVVFGVKAWRLMQHIGTYMRDIGSMPSRLRRIEDHTVRLTQRFTIHLDFADYATFETDQAGNCLATSHAFDRLSRRSTGEMLGNGWLNSICEEHRQRVIGEWRACLTDAREFHSRFTFCSDGHDPVSVICTVRPVIGLEGKPLQWFGFVQQA